MTIPMKTRYPRIYAVTEIIALDNGGINRNRSAERREDELEVWLMSQDVHLLAEIELWLVGKTPDQLATIASGGEGEPETVAALDGAPATLGDFLNQYFEEVC